MAVEVLTNCHVFVAGYDVSGQLNAAALDYAAEMLDATTFNQTTRIRSGGLKAVTAAHSGFWDAGAGGPDTAFFSRIGTQGVPMTILPNTGVAGSIAYFFRAIHGDYQAFGAVGDLTPFSVTAEGSDGEVPARGMALFNGTVTGDANGTAFVVGAASSAQTIVGALHIVGDPDGTTPTLDVTVESDVDGDFNSAATVLTFAQMTTRGSDWQTASGPNTDTFYRVTLDIGGTDDPSFAAVVVVGIIT